MKRRNECSANYSKTELLEHFQILVVSVTGGNEKGALKLKGRIYIRHIKQVMDMSIVGELCLMIDMGDE